MRWAAYMPKRPLTAWPPDVGDRVRCLVRTPTVTPEDIRTALARAPVAPGSVTVPSPDVSFYGGGTPSFDRCARVRPTELRGLRGNDFEAGHAASLVCPLSSGVIANITPLTARPSVIPYADARKPSFKVALTPAEQAAAGRPPLAGAVATTRTVQVNQQQQEKAGRRRKRFVSVQLIGVVTLVDG